MTILARNIDFTELDQEALERRIFRLIDTTFPEWSERNRMNYGNLLVGAMSMIGDLIAFILDNHAAESRWSTARLRRSLLSLVKLVAYRPASATASTVDVTITLPAASPGTLTLRAGTRILTDEVTNPIVYQLLADLVFEPGELVKSVTAENSIPHSEIFTSTELAGQVLVLGRTGVLDASVSVVAADGSYTEVTDFLDSRTTDRHFVLTVDAQDRGVIRLGDGVNGVIPRGSITVTYKTGGGAAGRVEMNRLRRFEGSFFDSLGNPVRPTVTNPAASSGGENRETNAAMRKNVPRSLRVQGRAVAREDYEIVAENLPGVARALHLTGNEVPSIGENQGQLFLVPEGGGTPSVALLNTVAAQFNPLTGPYPKTNTYQLLVLGAPYLAIDVTSTVWLAAGFTGTEGRAKARAQVLAALGLFFALTTTNDQGEVVDNERVNFGYYFKAADGSPANQLAWSDVFNSVRDVAALRKVDPGPNGFLLNGVRDDVPLSPQQFPVLGTVVLIDGQTGESF